MNMVGTVTAGSRSSCRVTAPEDAYAIRGQALHAEAKSLKDGTLRVAAPTRNQAQRMGAGPEPAEAAHHASDPADATVCNPATPPDLRQVPHEQHCRTP